MLRGGYRRGRSARSVSFGQRLSNTLCKNGFASCRRRKRHSSYGLSFGWAGIILLSLRSTRSAKVASPIGISRFARGSRTKVFMGAVDRRFFQGRSAWQQILLDGQGFEPWVTPRGFSAQERTPSRIFDLSGFTGESCIELTPR